MPTIVMTGGTSGFGALAVARLSEAGDARLVLGARTGAPGSTTLPLDLTSLDSVRRFATAARAELGATPVDAVVLNAGLIRPDAASRSEDGFETTFAVNHLAHYLLLRLLLPSLADGAVVVLTTSGTHDPATRAGLATPRHADADLLAHPDRDPDLEAVARKAGQHAYTASKLCAVLTARSLAQRADVRERRITAVAYDPGQVFGTGLAKDLTPRLRVAWRVLGTSVGAPLRLLEPTLNSRTAAGSALADLTLRVAAPPDGSGYAALRRGRLRWTQPSTLARRDDVARRLWEDSARLVELPA